MLRNEDSVDEEPPFEPAARLERTPTRPGSIEDIVAAPAKGRLASARLKAAKANRNFLILRTPLGGVKLSLHHAEVLKAVWAVWARKRAEGAADPGVSPAEAAAHLGVEAGPIRHILATLTRNRVIRSTSAYVGWRGARAQHYPTQAGIQALAFVEVLPMGSFVQVGRTTKVWKSRQDDAPPDLFQIVRLLKRGLDQGVPA